MSEYIKKDPLIEIAEQQGHVTIDDIINEPPANVAPIQYGQWILRGRKILCSKCRAVFEELKEEELFEVKADLPYLCEIEKFCFNCGARMVKEIEKQWPKKKPFISSIKLPMRYSHFLTKPRPPKGNGLLTNASKH